MPFRVTRNANTEGNEDQADDLVALIESELRERKFAPIVRLQVDPRMPPLQRGRTGDLKVVVNVAIPKKLNREQRELLERLADSFGEEAFRSDEGMLAKLRRVLAG